MSIVPAPCWEIQDVVCLTELITSKGFPCENYYITTEDGYIFNTLRIPHGRFNGHLKGPRPVVILQHGLLGSCSNFLDNLVNQSLAYILADAGADKEFWQFSWDEMAKYDLPAMINFVLNSTAVDQVYYVGHSQGTTIAFAEFSENQELASRIKHFIAMAPVAQVWNAKSPSDQLAGAIRKDIGVFLQLFGSGDFNVSPSIMQLLAGTLCESNNILCENILFLLGVLTTRLLTSPGFQFTLPTTRRGLQSEICYTGHRASTQKTFNTTTTALQLRM
ncbi:hypothetical protein Btru_060235 [Bulinus truncatus]|nr:hypothetical protein Btru_060235 [Bulinus truncatus]